MVPGTSCTSPVSAPDIYIYIYIYLCFRVKCKLTLFLIFDKVVIVSKLDKQTIDIKFDSNWMSHSSGLLVP